MNYLWIILCQIIVGSSYPIAKEAVDNAGACARMRDAWAGESASHANCCKGRQNQMEQIWKRAVD